MKDPEFILLRNRFLFGLLIIFVFAIPTSLFLFNKFGSKPSNIMVNLKQENSFLILVTEEKCNNCKELEKDIKSSNITCFSINKDRDRTYEELLRKLDIPTRDITAPTVIYIKEGKVYSKIIDTNSEELQLFIYNNKIESNPN